MKTIHDRLHVAYKKRNKNVIVSKRLSNYIETLSGERIDKKLLEDYRTITQSSLGSYQTPLNQLACMAMISRSKGVKNILEIGTFRGFSALYLVCALGKDTHVTTCEVNPHRAAEARAIWEKYDEKQQITLLEGPALATLQSLNQKFDLIYIDADKKEYEQYYILAKKLSVPGGLIMLDNMLWAGLVAHKKTGFSHASMLNDLNQRIYHSNHASVCMIPAWDGLLIVEN